jgi:type I restriction enzyme S subunit
MVVSNDYDMLMVMDGASSGRIEIGYSGIVGSTIAKIKINPEFQYPLSVFSFLKRKEKDIMGNTTGSSIPHTDKSKILDYTFPLANNEILIQFEELANPIFEK